MDKIDIISVRERPEIVQEAVAYFQAHWASSPADRVIYEDSITSCLGAASPLPQWYLLRQGGGTIGCAGLIPNDFISRMDLWPWLCALYVDEAHRGHAYGALLIGRAKRDAKALGFDNLYLCTDQVGYYERYGFERIATGYHPWGETSDIFRAALG